MWVGLALALALTNPWPSKVTTVERLGSGQQPTNITSDAWGLSGSGAIAREVTAPNHPSQVVLEKPSGLDFIFGRRFSVLDHGSLRVDFQLRAGTSALEVLTTSPAGPSLEVRFMVDGSIRVGGITASVDGGDYDTTSWNRMHLFWSRESDKYVYTLRVNDVTRFENEPVTSTSAVRNISFAVRGSDAGAWALSDFRLVDSFKLDFGRMAPNASVRVVGVDDEVIGESASVERLIQHRPVPVQIMPTPTELEPISARFQLLRDGLPVAAPSALIHNIWPGDEFRVGTEPFAREVVPSDKAPFPFLGIVLIGLAGVTYLAISPRISFVSLMVAAIIYAPARLLVTEMLLRTGLDTSGPNQMAVGAALATPFIVLGGHRLDPRARRALAWARTAPSALRPTAWPWALATASVIAVSTISALAIARIPTGNAVAHYAYVGNRWIQAGAIPYSDEWASKSPGLYLLFGLFTDTTGYGGEAILALRLIWTAALVGLVAVLGYHIGGGKAAVLSALTVGALAPWIEFVAPVAPHFGALPLLAGFALLTIGRKHRDPVADVASGAFLGAALVTNVQSLYALPLAAMLIWPASAETQFWPRTARVLAGGIGVVVVTVGYFVFNGAIFDVWRWLVVEASAHVIFWQENTALPAALGLPFLLWVPEPQLPLYLVLVVVLAALLLSRKWWAATFVALGILTQHISLKSLYRFGPHDYFVFTWLLAIGVAFLTAPSRYIARRPLKHLGHAARASGLAGVAVFLAVVVGPDQHRAYETASADRFDTDSPIVADQLRRITDSDRHLFIWNDNTQIAGLLNAPISGGWNQTHSADVDSSIKDRWVAAIMTDLPDAIVIPAGFDSDEFNSVRRDLAYSPVTSDSPAFDIYLRNFKITHLEPSTSPCELADTHGIAASLQGSLPWQYINQSSEEASQASSFTSGPFGTPVGRFETVLRPIASGLFVKSVGLAEGLEAFVAISPDGRVIVEGPERTPTVVQQVTHGVSVRIALKVTGTDEKTRYAVEVDGTTVATDIQPRQADVAPNSVRLQLFGRSARALHLEQVTAIGTDGIVLTETQVPMYLGGLPQGAGGEAAHQLLSSTPIQAHLSLLAKGTPEDLLIQFRSPAGTVLDLFLAADGTIRSGEPGNTEGNVDMHRLAASDLDVTAGGTSTTQTHLDIELVTASNVFAYSVRSDSRVVLAEPLSSRITNTSEIVFKLQPGDGTWSITLAQPMPSLLRDWKSVSLPNPRVRVDGVRPRDILQIVGPDAQVIAAAVVPLGTQSVDLPWHIGRADNVRLVVRHGRTLESRFNSQPLHGICAGDSFRLVEKTPA